MMQGSNLVSALLVLFVMAAPGAVRAAHDHAAPHGGTLVALGDHFAHLEVVCDARRGRLRIWVLDGEASAPVALTQGSIELKVRHLADAAGKSLREESLVLTARAVANPLTGETASRSSEFLVSHPSLRGVARFEALVKEFVVRGVPVRALRFPFPEGNEPQ